MLTPRDTLHADPQSTLRVGSRDLCVTVQLFPVNDCEPESEPTPRLFSANPPIPPTHSQLQYPMLSLQPHPCRSQGLVEMGLATTSYPSVLLLSLRSGPASGHLICPRMSVGCSVLQFSEHTAPEENSHVTCSQLITRGAHRKLLALRCF